MNNGRGVVLSLSLRREEINLLSRVGIPLLLAPFDLDLPRGRIFQPPRVSTSRRQRLEEAL